MACKDLNYLVPQWDSCSSELLLIIFDMLPGPDLSSCMFVNRRWRDIATSVAEKKELWREMVVTLDSNRKELLRLKSNVLDWRQIYENSILWNHIEKADLALHNTYPMPSILKSNIYRDNLIVVHSSYVKYYDIYSFKLRRDLKTTCLDFYENDHMIIRVNRGEHTEIYLFGKLTPKDFDIIESDDSVHIVGVREYRVEDNRCYVLDTRSAITVYILENSKWQSKFIARYYACIDQTCDMNVFNDEVYIIMAKSSRLFKASIEMTVPKLLNIDMPRFTYKIHKKGRTSRGNENKTLIRKMFHNFGFVFEVPGDYPFHFHRYSKDGFRMFLFLCPNLSCVTEHGELLFLGYSDGKMEIHMPRLKRKEEVCKRRLHIRDFRQDIRDVAIVSIEVLEDKGRHHLFVATSSCVFHLLITYPDSETYMWGNMPDMVEISNQVVGPRLDF